MSEEEKLNKLNYVYDFINTLSNFASNSLDKPKTDN